MKKCTKNVLRTILIISSIILLFNMKVEAAEPQVQLIGENIAKEGQQIMTIKITNDEEIGVVEGYIQGDDNIEIIEIAESFNGWMINYNSQTGKFNTFKASGTKDGEVLQIKYKVKDITKTAKITLNNIELTTITYDAIKIEENIVKEITVNNVEPEPDPEPDPDPDPEPDPTPEQDKKPTNDTKPAPSKNNNVTTSPNPLPKAGISYIIAMFIIFIAITGIICYKRYIILKKI